MFNKDYPISDFINNVEKDLRSLDYKTLVLLHIIMVIDRHSQIDKTKIFEIIQDEIYKRQQYDDNDNDNDKIL